MTDKEFYTIVGYLANPIRNTHIEVEIPINAQMRFAADYSRLTGGIPLPLITNTRPYYIWPAGADKWGIEVRMYFNSNNNLPLPLFNVLEPSKIQTRPGYDMWDRRVSRKKNIYPLIEAGFVIGSVQNLARITALVPSLYLPDFNIGFAL